MIFVLFTLDQGKNKKALDRFQSVSAQRYADRLSQPFERLDERRIFTSIKPFHAGILPYLLLDFSVQARAVACQTIFANDVLDFSLPQQQTLSAEDALRLLADLEVTPNGLLTSSFRGFGPRIDLALNTIARLYLECLFTLTRVEAEVIETLRTLQYERYQDPIQARSFGLQKVAAERLGKSPVAIHKSLKSSRFELISDTAKAMQSIIG